MIAIRWIWAAGSGRLFTALSTAVLLYGASPAPCQAKTPAAEVRKVTARGVEWLARQQSRRLGNWTARNGQYPTAMTGLAGMALLCEGSTTTQGKYAKNIRGAVDYLVSRSRANGLIGDPMRDNRYTYGHGFSMLFLSQVLGEEEDEARRKELIDVLTRAAEFSGRAQTDAGGWGYVSAQDGRGFDEGSTTITQVQGLRGCRNAGIHVPKEVIDKAIKYIHKCTLPDGGVQYNSQGGGGRPAITAAAVACLHNAGEYDSDYVPRQLKFCKGKLDNIASSGFGHWHYAHYYYSQVMYREGGKTWETYRDKIIDRLVKEASKTDGAWSQGYIGPVYTTSINLTILQLPNGALPIYQR
ncbi:MAG: terpene cyclase/mutase family protein [Candidatus Nealsonbacteria bacterium]|nr:terpene cyclase/mutase family protein [Candidatus Nealsonbacteria bacterium]